MKPLLLRYATPFISGLFLVSLISGIALFFHLGNATFRGMHEWLSMVLILPFVLHLWKNWRPLVKAGFSGASVDLPLNQIAVKSAKGEQELMATLAATVRQLP